MLHNFLLLFLVWNSTCLILFLISFIGITDKSVLLAPFFAYWKIQDYVVVLWINIVFFSSCLGLFWSCNVTSHKTWIRLIWVEQSECYNMLTLHGQAHCWSELHARAWWAAWNVILSILPARAHRWVEYGQKCGVSSAPDWGYGWRTSPVLSVDHWAMTRDCT